MNKSNTNKSSISRNKLGDGQCRPQPIPIPHTNQVVYRDGQGPPGQVFIIPRAVVIADFYGDTAIPSWTDVAEQVLRVHLAAREMSVWHLPPARRILREEAAVAEFFQGLIAWMLEGAERQLPYRVLYEAIRRLPGQAWFQETEGDAAYLQLWCRGIVQGLPTVL